MGKIEVVVGGQYGSEGKGHVTAQLAQRANSAPHVVRVAGPNAGHTAIGCLDGEKWALRAVPVAAVQRLDAQLYIAAGSEVDLGVLHEEVRRLDEKGYGVSERLQVDAQATLLDGDHQAREVADGLQERIGSTSKGIGAARAARIMREAEIVGGAIDVAQQLRYALRKGGHVIVEGTQGYGLGLHAGEYPYCTSSDCRAIDFLAMAGLSPWSVDVEEFDIWVVARTYPIRVAGNSGPLPEELTWQALALRSCGYIQPERTTVTQKVRRVAEYNTYQVEDAMKANGWPSSSVHLALTFVDYLDRHVAGGTRKQHLSQLVTEWIDDHCRPTPELVTTGPGTAIWLED